MFLLGIDLDLRPACVHINSLPVGSQGGDEAERREEGADVE
jgi:hypothetical protein